MFDKYLFCGNISAKQMKCILTTRREGKRMLYDDRKQKANRDTGMTFHAKIRCLSRVFHRPNAIMGLMVILLTFIMAIVLTDAFFTSTLLRTLPPLQYALGCSIPLIIFAAVSIFLLCIDDS
jgi:hypothetical protein